MKKTILIVDDKINTLKVLCAILEDEGYRVLTAKNGQEALTIYETEKRIDVVLSDMKMPEINGLELFHRLRSLNSKAPFVIMTAYGSIESAVDAMKQGVAHYLIKPLNYDELGIVLERTLRSAEMTIELADLRREVREHHATKEIIGSHPTMQRVFELLETVAPTDAPVLIYGETGTGKELLAKAIKALSSRSDRPMICLNSAALPDNLLEAELFGYRKGAFTGAVANKKGRLEGADCGTLFLDEIGHMSMSVQTKLLRFLQDGSFDSMGGGGTRHVDVRVIAATNKNLEEEIAEKRFLSDLLYRIEVFTITLPPLRERGEDVLLLARHFAEKYADKYKKQVAEIEQEALDALMAYTWPGNIRELENCMARSVIVSKSNMIQIRDLPEKIYSSELEIRSITSQGVIGEIPEQGMSLKEIEAELIEKILFKCDGNKLKSAAMLGISRKTLYEKIALYDLKSTLNSQ